MVVVMTRPDRLPTRANESQAQRELCRDCRGNQYRCPALRVVVKYRSVLFQTTLLQNPLLVFYFERMFL